jgi:hypothetical protein
MLKNTLKQHVYPVFFFKKTIYPTANHELNDCGVLNTNKLACDYFFAVLGMHGYDSSPR